MGQGKLSNLGPIKTLWGPQSNGRVKNLTVFLSFYFYFFTRWQFISNNSAIHQTNIYLNCQSLNILKLAIKDVCFSPLGCVVVLSFKGIIQSVFVVKLENVGLLLSQLLVR